MKPYNADEVLAKHKRQITDAMKKSLQPNAKNENLDDLIKQQVSKGWIPTKNSLNKDRILCLNCGNLLRSNTQKLQEKPHSKCTRCQREFTL